MYIEYDLSLYKCVRGKPNQFQLWTISCSINMDEENPTSFSCEPWVDIGASVIYIGKLNFPVWLFINNKWFQNTYSSHWPSWSLEAATSVYQGSGTGI